MKSLNIHEKIELKGMISRQYMWNHVRNTKGGIKKFYQMIIDGTRWGDTCLETARGNHINYTIAVKCQGMNIQPDIPINRGYFL